MRTNPKRWILTGLEPIAQPPGRDTLAFLNLDKRGPKTITPALIVFKRLYGAVVLKKFFLLCIKIDFFFKLNLISEPI